MANFFLTLAVLKIMKKYDSKSSQIVSDYPCIRMEKFLPSTNSDCKRSASTSTFGAPLVLRFLKIIHDSQLDPVGQCLPVVADHKPQLIPVIPDVPQLDINNGWQGIFYHVKPAPR